MTFFLGRRVTPPDADTADDDRVLYDPKHLTTHGLVFGMTGSGKTGLCVGLLEEAGREGIPVIAIDPKGDLTNLALCWPDLAPSRFAEWIDPSRVEDGRVTAAELGAGTAEIWRSALAREGIDSDEIRRYRERNRLTIYTPGSSAGVQVSLLDRFDAPPGFDRLTEEDKSELIAGIVAAVLGLVRISADPLQSREFILLSNLIAHAWERRQALDLPCLIQLINDPPIAKLGVFELDDFIPARRRRELAMQLNGLIASPSFQPWLTGVPLDIDQLLRREAGGSQTSVFYIAHLEDSERMAFVSLLLDRVIGWMRAQSGTGSLRAILYMDEVFGYLPPHPHNPPTKRPLMTLLKQARAYGVGVLLATQNPVDIDYKGVGNAGTWFIGKLQTEQDKDRILDGLMSASVDAGKPVSRADISRRISALEGRQFLLQNAHEGEQVTFRTRFVRSYLRGPMTRPEITRLEGEDFYNLRRAPGAERPARPAPERVEARLEVTETHTPASTGQYVELDSEPAAAPAPRSVQSVKEDFLRARAPAPPRAVAPAPSPSDRPRVLGVEERFLASVGLRAPGLREVLGVHTFDAGGRIHYRPALMAQANLAFQVQDVGVVAGGAATRLVFPVPEAPGAVSWMMADARLAPEHLEHTPQPGAIFSSPPRWLHSPADRERAHDLFVRTLLSTQTARIPACPPLGRYGEPGESLDAFRARLASLLAVATDRVLERQGGRRAVEESIWDRQIEEMRELLEMDRRELAQLRASGDGAAFERANFRVKHRMARYRELLATRDKFLGLQDRAMADTEFAAMDHLEACRLVDVTLRPQGVEALFFGILWVPNQ